MQEQNQENNTPKHDGTRLNHPASTANTEPGQEAGAEPGTSVEVHNLIILDESGSMFGSRDLVISGFNELLQQMKGIEKCFPAQQHFVSLVSFNSFGIKHLNWRNALKGMEELNTEKYQPGAMTPLYDAMGLSIGKLRNDLQQTPNKNVLVTIFTDGLENDSREFTAENIRELVETLKTENWVFTYIGTNHDTVTSREKIGIKQGMHFTNSKEGIDEMFSKEYSMRKVYSAKIDRGELFKDEEDLYEDS